MGKGKQVIAISFSDLHNNNWKKFNQGGNRTDSHLLVLGEIFKAGIDLNVPILFCGDWVHTPEYIDMDLAIKLAEFYDKYSNELKLKVIGINGNHDLPKPNTYQERTKGYLHTLDLQYHWMRCIDFKSVSFDSVEIHGIPYLDHNVGLSKAISDIKLSKTKRNILLLHTDYAGARDTNGKEIYSTSIQNINPIKLRKFDLVLCGHIHKHQKLGNNIYMVGAPLQQRFTDEGNKMGYVEIYSDLTVKFKEITGSPVFRTLSGTNEQVELGDNEYYRYVSKVGGSRNGNIQGHTGKKGRAPSKKKIFRKYFREVGVKDKDKIRAFNQVMREAEDDQV